MTERIRNPKFEIRNPKSRGSKQIQNSNFQNSKQKEIRYVGNYFFVLVICILVIYVSQFVSNFGFRASDLNLRFNLLLIYLIVCR